MAILLVDTLREYWKSQLQTALCGWSEMNRSFKRDRKAHVGVHSGLQQRGSVHKHSQTCTTASTRVSLVLKTVVGLLVEKLIW